MRNNNEKQVRKPDVICLALAFFALTASVPFYAFNRSADNVASFYCREFFRYVPGSVTNVVVESTLSLKRAGFLDEGFPSGVWCFSWTLLLLLVWGNTKRNRIERIAWCVLPILLNTLWEILQHYGAIGGNGNMSDCLCGLSGGLFAFIVHQSTMKHHEGLLWHENES